MFYLTLICKTLPSLSKTLGKGFLDGVVLYFRLLCFLIIKKLRKTETPWEFHFDFRGKPLILNLYEGSPDVAALSEIFIDGEYEWEAIPNPKEILDLGAHTGNTALYFHSKYPEARIYAVEASPKNYARLVENTKTIAQIQPIFGAIADKDGTLEFHESKSSLGSSIVHRDESSSVVTVPCFTLETLFSRYTLSHVDLMKIDIEGSEGLLFSTLLPEAFSRSYSIEVHDDLMAVSREEFLNKFVRYELAFQKTNHPQRVLLYAKLRVV